MGRARLEVGRAIAAERLHPRIALEESREFASIIGERGKRSIDHELDSDAAWSRLDRFERER